MTSRALHDIPRLESLGAGRKPLKAKPELTQRWRTSFKPFPSFAV